MIGYLLKKLFRYYLRKQASSYLGSFCEVVDTDGKAKFHAVCVEDLGNNVLLKCVHSGFEFSCPKESPYLKKTEKSL